MSDIEDRYDRAARRSAPKAARRRRGVGHEGHWLPCGDYFLVDARPGADGVLQSVPRRFMRRAGRLEDLVSPDALEALLSPYVPPGFAADPTLRLGMVDDATLGLAVAGQEFFIDITVERLVARREVPRRAELFSPDGQYAAFVRGEDLWLRERTSGTERRLTQGGERHCAYGQAPESGLSAISYRAAPVPIGLWSEDSSWLLTHRIDERALGELALIQHVPPDGGRPRLHCFRYPLPGEALPTATLVAIHVASGRIMAFEPAIAIGIFSPFFLKHVWFDGAHAAYVLAPAPDGCELTLWALDLASGASRPVVAERAVEGLIDPHMLMARAPNVHTLHASGEVIWYSERTGVGHLYLHDTTSGELKAPITTGDWMVRDLVHVDTLARRVYFLAAARDGRNPALRSLCAIGLDGRSFTELERGAGDLYVAPDGPLDQYAPFRPFGARSGGMAPDGALAVGEFGDPTNGNVAAMLDLEGGAPAVPLYVSRPEPEGPRAERFETLAADGTTRLYGLLLLPHERPAGTRCPLIDLVYPGPHVAQVPQFYGSVDGAQAEALAELGFAVMMLDTRGQPPGSRAHRQAGLGSLSEPQMADHAAAVRCLVERDPRIDGARCGIVGFSSGGLAAVEGMLRYGDVYRVGVAACGSYYPSLYAASWSMRYLGHGQPAPAVSEGRIRDFDGKLFLIAGDMDENVHVAQTLRLAARFISASRDIEMLIVPNEGHMVLMTSGYAQRRMWDFFVAHLLGELPPAHYDLRYASDELAACFAGWGREIRR